MCPTCYFCPVCVVVYVCVCFSIRMYVFMYAKINFTYSISFAWTLLLRYLLPFYYPFFPLPSLFLTPLFPFLFSSILPSLPSSSFSLSLPPYNFLAPSLLPSFLPILTSLSFYLPSRTVQRLKMLAAGREGYIVPNVVGRDDMTLSHTLGTYI